MRVRVQWAVMGLLALLLIGVAPVLTPGVHAQDKSLVWEQFDVDIEVNPDGSFDVDEHQTIRFTSGSGEKNLWFLQQTARDLLQQGLRQDDLFEGLSNH